MTRRIMILLVCFLVTVLLLTGCLGASTPVHEDLDLLVKKIKAVHPLGRTGFPQEFYDTVHWAEIEYKKGLNSAESISVLTRVLASVGDAHTTAHHGVSSGLALNLPLLWLEDGLYVGNQTEKLHQGDKIVRIGDLSTEDIFEQLKLYISAENLYWLRVKGESDLQCEALLRSLGLVNSDDTVTLEYISINTKDLQRVELPLEPYELGKTLARNPTRAKQGWQIDEEHSLGYFYLDVCTTDQVYKQALKAFFTAVKDKGIGNIAVDLRHNGGGNSLATNEFLRYIDISRYRSYSHEMRIKGWINVRLNLNQAGKIYRSNKVHSNLAFSGRVFILTSNQTFSAANWFVTVFHDNALATVVGEPIGNSPSAYGNMSTSTLPTSGLRFSVSMSSFERPNPAYDPQDSLYPHIYVATTMEDILAGRDPQLDVVKAIINGYRKNK